MTQISTFVRGSTAGGQVPSGKNTAPRFLENILDFSRITHSATDSIDFLTIKAGSVVALTGVEVIVADTAGNSGTVKVRQGTTDRGTAITPTSTGDAANGSGVTPIQATADTNINLLTATGTTNGTYRVWAWVFPNERRGGAAGGTADTLSNVYESLT